MSYKTYTIRGTKSIPVQVTIKASDYDEAYRLAKLTEFDDSGIRLMYDPTTDGVDLDYDPDEGTAA